MNKNNLELVKVFNDHNNNTKKNSKTRMCKNAGTCIFGDACHYAHSADEIIIIPCAYKDSCVFIQEYEYGCYNSDTKKTCYFKHPCETDHQYHLRVGNIKHSGEENTSFKPTCINLEKINKKDIVKCKINNTTSETNEPQSEIYEDTKETNINVKAKDVMSVIEDLLEREITCVKLCIDYDD